MYDLDRIAGSYSYHDVACIDRANEGVRRFYSYDIRDLCNVQQCGYSRQEIFSKRGCRCQYMAETICNTDNERGHVLGKLLFIAFVVSDEHIRNRINS